VRWDEGRFFLAEMETFCFVDQLIRISPVNHNVAVFFRVKSYRIPSVVHTEVVQFFLHEQEFHKGQKSYPRQFSNLI